MKKILNEWNKFLLNENQPAIDKALRAPKGWFGGWNYRMGLLETREWKDYIDKTYPHLKQDLEQEYSGNPKFKEQFVQNVIGSIKSGYSYYVFNYLGKEEFKNLVNKKLDEYFNSTVTEEEKDFLVNNVDNIFKIGLQTMVPNSTKVWHKDMKKPYSGTVAFFAKVNDWFMFGDAFDATKAITKEYVSKRKKDQ